MWIFLSNEQTRIHAHPVLSRTIINLPHPPLTRKVGYNATIAELGTIGDVLGMNLMSN